ncbi:hypothetical protein [Tsukamurella soli]|uniref:Uncharacterized protein n=1 Tax=Tsukamurella soli TaxID=644556 RepID=A0ABP8J746_9ACTN
MSTNHLVDGAEHPLGDAYRRTLRTVPTTTAATVVYAGVLAAVVLAALVYFVGFRGTDAKGGVTTVSAIEVGDCVTVGSGHPTKAPCSTGTLTFGVAEKLPGRTACSSPAYARIEADGDSLCVVPNLTLGQCYRVPGPSAATTDISPVDCPSALTASSGNVIQVTESASGGPLDCRGATALNYEQPRRLSYCVQPLS